MLREFSPALRVYLLLISIAGPVAALMASTLGAGVGRERWLAAALLAACAVVAVRFPLQFTVSETVVDVSSAAYMAMILVLPVGLPGLLVLFAGVAGNLWRRREPVEIWFNAGQFTLLCHSRRRRLRGRQVVVGGGMLGTLLAAILAAAALHIVNTALVACAAGLQLGTSPLRVWRSNAAEDLPAHAALSLLGGVAAVLALAQPLLLPALALPAVLVHVAVRNYIRLRADTTEALASLIDIVELRDPYTAGHSRRVAETARALALRLGLTTEEADQIAERRPCARPGQGRHRPRRPQQSGQAQPQRMAGDVRASRPRRDGAGQVRRLRAGHRWCVTITSAGTARATPTASLAKRSRVGARILAVADTLTR